MGCDIHIKIEVKNSKTKKWEEITIEPPTILPDRRNYELFGFLFGVRGEAKTDKFVNRGFPEDLSIDTLIDYSEYHSQTYIYADEFEKIKWPEELKNCYFRIFGQHVLPNISPLCNLRHIRLIIAFDS